MIELIGKEKDILYEYVTRYLENRKEKEELKNNITEIVKRQKRILDVPENWDFSEELLAFVSPSENMLLRNKVMPGEELKKNIVYHGHCQDLLANIPDNYFRLIFVDPPIETITLSLVQEFARVLQENDACIYQECDNNQDLINKIISIYEHVGLRFLHSHTVADKNSAGDGTDNGIIIIFTRSGDHYLKNFLQQLNWKRFPIQQQLCSEIMGMQRPVETMAQILNQSTNPDDIVFDPFAGSGSMGVAALGMNRLYIGAEIKEDLAKKANVRLLNYKYEFFEQLQIRLLNDKNA